MKFVQTHVEIFIDLNDSEAKEKQEEQKERLTQDGCSSASSFLDPTDVHL